MTIRLFDVEDTEAVVALSLLAWQPVFASFEQVLGTAIYTRIYPDWIRQQRDAVMAMVSSEAVTSWVAVENDTVVGFISWDVNLLDVSAEIQMLAVHPDFQNRGIGTELNRFALQTLQTRGIKLVAVATGGDPGHAPARRSYEKAGFTPLPLIRYYKALE